MSSPKNEYACAVVVHAEAIEEIVIFLLAQKFNVLNFSGCSMGPPGAVAVSHLLMSNKDLVSLDLSSFVVPSCVCLLFRLVTEFLPVWKRFCGQRLTLEKWTLR